jgi:hypothetical protein
MTNSTTYVRPRPQFEARSYFADETNAILKKIHNLQCENSEHENYEYFYPMMLGHVMYELDKAIKNQKPMKKAKKAQH